MEDEMANRAVIEVTEATFEDEVLRRSAEVPVVVDFWADWCGPCRRLGPILEQLALEANGEWILAKVDVDRNESLAASFGVQGIPAVRAFRNGRQVAEFVGALPEPQVRAWLQRLGPSPADLAIAEGQAAEKAGENASAAEAYRRALAHEPARLDARAGLARAELALRAEGSDEDVLRALAGDKPADVDAGTALADLEFARGDALSAFDRLIELVRLTNGEERERARLHLLRLLDALPPDDPRAMDARRGLANALY